MIKAEFGIIEDIRETQEYSYDSKKYQCVCIDDDVYIDEWWNRPEFGLARWGITLIPPESLPGFQDIVLSDKRISEDVHLRELADKIQDAISRNKFMIHLGV